MSEREKIENNLKKALVLFCITSHDDAVPI